MPKPLFSNSTRKYIRLQKSHIRREFSDVKKQRELIQELYQRFIKNPDKKEKAAPKKVSVKKKAKGVAAK